MNGRALRLNARRASLLLLVAIGGCTSSAPPSSSVAPSSPPSLPTVAGPVTMLVDTDVAPDDLVAIAFLIGAPEVSVAAITVSGTGEAHCVEGVAIVLRLLERLRAPEIPVACGREQPLGLDHAFPEPFRDNADRAAGLPLPDTTRQPASGDAVSLIRRTLVGGDGPLRVLTLGPLTNLAEALQKDPALVARIDALYVMGGAVDVPGNVAGSPGAPADNTAAEWNIYADPAAAAIVFDTAAPIFLVSLDGTNQVPITPSFVQLVRDQARAPGLQVLADLLTRNSYMTDGGYYLWDAVAAISAAGYSIGEFAAVRLSVDEAEGASSGATRRTSGTPNANFLSSAQADTVEALLLSVLNAE